jgi:hypothetical protein
MFSSSDPSKTHTMSWTDIKKGTFGLRWWRRLCRDSAGLWVVQSGLSKTASLTINFRPTHTESSCAHQMLHGRRKRENTPPNQISQLTDHAISRTINVLRFRFVINTRFKRGSLHGSEEGEKKSDHVRDWKNVKPSQQGTRFTVTDHSTRVQTGIPFWPFNQAQRTRENVLSAMSRTGKINRHQQTNLRKSLITLSHTQTAGSHFWLETNTKFEQRNPDESDKGGKKNTPSNGQFLSSTLKNGLIAEHFSVCWMRRAQLRS